MHIYIYRPNKNNKDSGWWIFEIGIKRYKLTHTTYLYFLFLFWVLCMEIKKKDNKNE